MTTPKLKRKLTDQLQCRELGLRRKLDLNYEHERNLHHRIVSCWKQRQLSLGTKNKVFASTWLSEESILYGTKCNKLSLININTSKEDDIPLLRGFPKTSNDIARESCDCGIHSVVINPSGTMLATGGENVSELGVYKLPDLTPVCALGGAHRDWVFDICWLDDECLVSCSRDRSLAIWRVNPDENSFSYFRDGHGVQRSIGSCKSDDDLDRFRAVDYCREYNVLAVLTMSSKLYLYDPTRLVSRLDGCTNRLALASGIRETVALRKCPNRPEILSVCSQALVLCMDVRCPNNESAFKISSVHGDCGIRSINFKGDLLSYGTSQGGVLFYDIRARRHLSSNTWCHPLSMRSSYIHSIPIHYSTTLELNVGNGWVRWEPSLDDLSFYTTAAVYTHEYDPSGTKLFAAGGPITAAYYGNVACLWE